MAVKFLPDGFIIWKVKLGKYESTQAPIDTFVVAPDLVAAHEAAMNWEREVLQDDNVILSVSMVSDCILDGR